VNVKNSLWANYVKEKRKSKNLTRRKLAELSKVDPSYLTLIERDGFVPRKDKVVRIARALDCDIDECLLTAGYAPQRVPVTEFLERLERYKDDRDMDEDLKKAVREIRTFPADEQKKVAQMISAYLQVLNKDKDE
jgi:transcriptional regulator with XRE-family HTH domain